MYLIIAEDPFDRREAIHSLGGEPEEVDAQRLTEELNTLPLFGGERTLLIRKADQLPKGVVEVVKDYFTSGRGGVRLILEAEKLPPKSPLRRCATRVIEMALPPPWERDRYLAEWLVSRVNIEPQAAYRLVTRVGHDKGLLMSEAEKLSTYTDGEPIDSKAVEALAVGFPHEVVWELGRAIMARQSGRALAIWRHLAAQGSVPLAILPVLRTQMQRGHRICQQIASGGHPDEKPHRIAEAKKYGLADCRKALVAIFEVELACKNGIEEGAIERLIARLC